MMRANSTALDDLLKHRCSAFFMGRMPDGEPVNVLPPVVRAFVRFERGEDGVPLTIVAFGDDTASAVSVDPKEVANTICEFTDNFAVQVVTLYVSKDKQAEAYIAWWKYLIEVYGRSVKNVGYRSARGNRFPLRAQAGQPLVAVIWDTPR